MLKANNPNSVALKYDNIIGLKRLERQALVKGMDIVYIYHDKVDEASHTSDSAVFPACDDAIAEIKNLIRIIVNEFGGTNVIVTADHGFLYTYSPLSEDDKVDKTSPSDQDVEIDRRYLITKKGAKPDYLLPVRFMDGQTEYDAFAPRENVRIKKKGGGLNFVHGGISLQEMVVPVLEFQFLRNAYKMYQRNKDKIDTKPVTISLLSASRKISNMIFSLNFYQKEAVGGNREAATYLLYFVDVNGQKISDTSGIPLVTSKNLTDGIIDFETAKDISIEDAAAINSRSRVDDGDILFAMIGTIGNPVLVKKDREFCIKNMALFKQIDASLLDMRYVLLFLQRAQTDMKAIANASVQSFVSLTLLRNYLFPLPPLGEQKRIVARLEELLPLCERLK